MSLYSATSIIVCTQYGCMVPGKRMSFAPLSRLIQNLLLSIICLHRRTTCNFQTAIKKTLRTSHLYLVRFHYDYSKLGLSYAALSRRLSANFLAMVGLSVCCTHATRFVEHRYLGTVTPKRFWLLALCRLSQAFSPCLTRNVILGLMRRVFPDFNHGIALSKLHARPCIDMELSNTGWSSLRYC